MAQGEQVALVARIAAQSKQAELVPAKDRRKLEC